LPDAEAARALEIAVGTFKSRLHRASIAMRAAVEADDRVSTIVKESIA
jgi:DNA-directed RNA polymerase specialized sigma24 family protein